MTAAARPTLSADLEQAVRFAPELWRELSGARIFITGGTGFFGTWLLETLLCADRAYDLGVEAVVLTRDPTAFLERNPHLAEAHKLSFRQGDVRTFELPSGTFSHVIHAATQASVTLNRKQPELMRDVIVSGTRRALDLALRSGARRFLLASSGAVYGRQRPDIAFVGEDDLGLAAPLETPDAYAEGKREAESLCRQAAQERLTATIARGFAFVGPHLPLGSHFAIGNFIRDALRGGPIDIRGDGTPYRSYLYASDLAVWLWTILLKGAGGRAYNVGSERRITVGELARLVAAEISPGAEVRIAEQPVPGRPPEQYVPSTARARSELGLTETVCLESALRRTASWVKAGSTTDAGP